MIIINNENTLSDYDTECLVWTPESCGMYLEDMTSMASWVSDISRAMIFNSVFDTLGFFSTLPSQYLYKYYVCTLDCIDVEDDAPPDEGLIRGSGVSGVTIYQELCLDDFVSHPSSMVEMPSEYWFSDDGEAVLGTQEEIDEIINLQISKLPSFPSLPLGETRFSNVFDIPMQITTPDIVLMNSDKSHIELRDMKTTIPHKCTVFHNMKRAF